MPATLASSTTDPAERFRTLEADCRQELEQTREQETEIQMLLQQTNIEIDKLTQRESTIVTRVRDMEINLENYSRSDIKAFYTAAHEVNLRLFMMRGQAEQLQARQQYIKERQEQLGLIISLLTTHGVGSTDEPAASAASATPTPTTRTVDTSLSHLIEVQESERLRISRYLHDGPAQMVANLVLQAEICEHLIERDTKEAKAELRGLRSSLTQSLQEIRRLIFDLRPMILDDIGLVPTLRRYLTNAGRERGFTATVRGPETSGLLSMPVRALLFRLVQDLLTGLTMHTPIEQVTVDIAIHASTIELTVEVRATADSEPPDFETLLAQEEVAQRLNLLLATTQVSPAGERGAQLVVRATPPTE